MPNQERLLVLADEAKDARWNLQALTDRPATERETVDREVTLWRLTERRKEAAEAKLESLGLIDAYPGVISGYMNKCTLCGECIDACPQWSEELRAALAGGKDAFVQALLSASQRLASLFGVRDVPGSLSGGDPAERHPARAEPADPTADALRGRQGRA